MCLLKIIDWSRRYTSIACIPADVGRAGNVGFGHRQEKSYMRPIKFILLLTVTFFVGSLTAHATYKEITVGKLKQLEPELYMIIEAYIEGIKDEWFISELTYIIDETSANMQDELKVNLTECYNTLLAEDLLRMMLTHPDDSKMAIFLVRNALHDCYRQASEDSFNSWFRNKMGLTE